MEYAFVGGRLRIARTPEEKEELLLRLRRIEGQVRGLQQMIADDRYCLEDVQQLNAITAAAREVSLRLISDHLQACVDCAVQSHEEEAVIAEMVTVLRAALRQ